MKRRIACLGVIFILILSCFNISVFADEETPVIIIPGYMGSKLYADAEFNERLFGEYGNAAELLTVGESELFVKEPVNLQKAAEYGAGNKYKALCNALCNAFPKRKIYFFSYDFTKETKTAAAALNSFVNSIGGKADFVCYSYGGLVATHYFALDNNNYNKINKTVCIGVPFEGSVYAQLAVDKKLLDTKDIGELLPTKKYIEKTEGSNEGGVNQEYLYSDGKSVMLKNKNAYYAVGGGKITAAKTVYNENGGIADMLFDNNGDGTVTALSATILDGVKDNIRLFDLTHSQLISSNEVINWVISVINGNGEFSTDNFKKGYDVIKINGDADLSVTGPMGVMEEEGIPLVQNEYGQLLELDSKNKIAAIVRSDSSITLKGNGEGFVNLYIRRFDENNKMICDNAFTEIPVSNESVIKTIVADDEMWLYIDKNSDGVFEESACSLKNGEYSFTTKTPVPSVKEGKYNKSFKLKLESGTEKADIYYTLDGSDPLENGVLYTEEIKIDKSCTLKAVSVKQNYTTGKALEINYEINKAGIIITVLLWLVLIAVIVAVITNINKKKAKNNTNGLQENTK